MRAKYKLLSAALALVGANSVIFPVYLGKNWKSTIKSLFVNSKNQDLSLNSINELRTSNDQQLKINNPLVNNSVNQINTQEIVISPTTEMKLEVSEETTNLVDLPNWIGIDSLTTKPAIKQIYREIKRSDSVLKIEKDESELIKKEIQNLQKHKNNFEAAASIVKTYNEESEEGKKVICTNSEDTAHNCFADKTGKISKLSKEQRIAIRDFFISYVNLSKKMLDLESRLVKSGKRKNGDSIVTIKNKDSLIEEIEKKDQKLTKILNYLQELNWDEEEMLFKYKANKNGTSFGWAEKWDDNPFNLFLDSKEKWELHMRRIDEINKNKKLGEITKKEAKEEIQKVHNEIILMIATNLLKRMKQIEISDEERENVDFLKLYETRRK